MKEYPVLFSPPMVRAIRAGRKFVTRRLDPKWLKVKAGDRLWVRETWAPYDGESAAYLADYPDSIAPWHPKNEFRRWKPSIHMPRKFSRILLECEENARAERLWDMTDLEARLEGVQVLPLQSADDPSAWWQVEPGEHQARTPRAAFRSLWSSLHADEGETWESNPEIIRVGKFRVIE